LIASSPQHAARVRFIGAVPASLVTSESSQDRSDVLRIVTFYMGLALVFVKFGMLHEIQTHVMGFKAYLLYIFGIPAGMGVLAAGGLRRTLTGRPAYYWIAFGVWMLICVPFSFWRGSSFGLVRMFFRDDLLILFVIGGLVVSWRECRHLMKVLAVAALVNVLASRIFSTAMSGGRLTLEFGNVANANDFAAHLLLTLPFLLLLASNSKSILLRAAVLLPVGYGIVVIFKTASRGALLALIVGTLFVLFRGNYRQRIAVACLVPITIVAILAFVPAGLLQRIRSFSAAEQNVSSEAMESSDARHYLLMKAIHYAIEFPIFGVGPGQFANYEGSHNRVLGKHGLYHAVHNTYVEAFTETGVVGGVLLLSAYISSFLMLNRTYREARRRTDCQDIQNTAFYIMLGMVGFCAAIMFLNFMICFYGPALAGLAISVSRAAKYEFAHRQPAAGPGLGMMPVRQTLPSPRYLARTASA